MEAIPNYRTLCSVITAITGGVKWTTGDLYVHQICTTIEDSLADGDDVTALFEMGRLSEWYGENLCDLLANPGVVNKNVHRKAATKELPLAVAAAESHPEWFEACRNEIAAGETAARNRRRMVFLSHSSADWEYVEAFVNLLRGLKLDSSNLFCSSYHGFDIPLGQRIFDFLKNCFHSYELCVIFLLSRDNYYSSATSLNEMGAAWVQGARCYSVLLPGMDYKMMEGAIASESIAVKLGSSEAAFRLNDLKNGLIDFLGIAQPNENIWQSDRDAFIADVRRIAENRMVSAIQARNNGCQDQKVRDASSSDGNSQNVAEDGAKDQLKQGDVLRPEDEGQLQRLGSSTSYQVTVNNATSFPWDEFQCYEGRSPRSEYKDVVIPISVSWRQLFSLFGPGVMETDSLFSSHFALDRAVFGEGEPYFGFSDRDFQLMLVRFVKAGVISVENDKVHLTDAGMSFLINESVDMSEFTEESYSQVKECINSESRKIRNYLDRLSDFDSNPNSNKYIGKTLIDLSSFLSESQYISTTDVIRAQEIIKEVLKEATGNRRSDTSESAPVFNLSRILDLTGIIQYALIDGKA